MYLDSLAEFTTLFDRQSKKRSDKLSSLRFLHQSLPGFHRMGLEVVYTDRNEVCANTSDLLTGAWMAAARRRRESVTKVVS